MQTTGRTHPGDRPVPGMSSKMGHTFRVTAVSVASVWRMARLPMVACLLCCVVGWYGHESFSDDEVKWASGAYAAHTNRTRRAVRWW